MGLSLLNGISAGAASAGDFFGKAGLAQQKSDLEQQTLTLANQLKEGSDIKLAGINQTNELARIPVQGEQNIKTAQATAAAQGDQTRRTATYENTLPMTEVQKATNRVQQQEADARTTEAKKPTPAGFGAGWLVPDKTSPDGYKVISITGANDLGPPDPTSNNLSKQIGLSENGIHALTGDLSGRAAIPYVTEANAWAAKNNVNISTLKASAKAVNETLKATSERNQLGVIQEREIMGSIDTIKPILDDMNSGKISKANVLKIWAGEQVNDPDAIKAVDQFTRLREELAGYNAIANAKITNGHPNPEQNEIKAAGEVVSNGMNSGSLKAFGESIASSAQKNREILQKSEDDANAKMFSLFNGTYHPPERKQAVPVTGDAGAATTAAPANTPKVPPLPPGVPKGSQFSASRNMWRDSSGKMYNADGSEAK